MAVFFNKKVNSNSLFSLELFFNILPLYLKRKEKYKLNSLTTTKQRRKKMNKNEFVENLVKEFSVKHPNYSASVKKPEEEPVTDDVCAMFQKNRTVILVHMDAAFEDYCQYGIEVVLQKIDNSLTYCEKSQLPTAISPSGRMTGACRRKDNFCYPE